jgi:hypothetical protein
MNLEILGLLFLAGMRGVMGGARRGLTGHNSFAAPLGRSSNIMP